MAKNGKLNILVIQGDDVGPWKLRTYGTLGACAHLLKPKLQADRRS
jgi:hypothetical protein